MNGYITIQEAAQKWNVTNRQVQIWCKEGKISGAHMLSRIWIIPENAKRPIAKKKSIPATNTVFEREEQRDKS